MLKGLDMIKLVVSGCGYAESGQIGSIFWAANEPLAVDKALPSLATNLADLYMINNRLFSHYTCKSKDEDYLLNKCSACGKNMRRPFDVDKFQSWIIELAGMDNDSYGGEDLDDWDLYVPYEESHRIKLEETLVVSFYFETLMAQNIVKEGLLNKEEIDAFDMDAFVPNMIKKSQHGYWETDWPNDSFPG